ncbi:MAG: hypothetical protein R3F19_20150 [Verrucomicrobiales bacterium]
MGASSFGITLRSGASFAGNFGTLTGFGAITRAGLISAADTELAFGLGISAGSGRVVHDDMDRQMANAPVSLCTNTGNEKFLITNTWQHSPDSRVFQVPQSLTAIWFADTAA